MAAVGTSMKKIVKTHFIFFTEVLDSDFKNAFFRNFQFHHRDPNSKFFPEKTVSKIFPENEFLGRKSELTQV